MSVAMRTGERLFLLITRHCTAPKCIQVSDCCHRETFHLEKIDNVDGKMAVVRMLFSMKPVIKLTNLFPEPW